MSLFSSRTIIIVMFLIVAACGRNRQPGLSDKELFGQQKYDMEIYFVSPGIKYKESRTVDPANPPVVFDIANRKLNIRKFNLSDYYSKVRYVKLKHPKSETKGTFLLDIRRSNVSSMNEKVWRHRDFIMGRSVFKFTDDYIVAGDACFGLHCYDKEGNFLYTIESNDFPKTYDATQSSITFAAPDVKGFYGRITVNGNNCLYCVMEDNKSMLCLYDLTQKKRIMTRPFEGRAFFGDNESIANYVYHPVYMSDDFLFTFDLEDGDTLCRFPSYNPIPEIEGNTFVNPSIPDIYYYENQLTIRQTLNDTVYRMISPDRLLPTYVLNFGFYRVDVQTYLFGDLSEKLIPYKWRETNQYVLFIYTQINKNQNNRSGESVTFFYSYFDKKSRQLYHFSEGTVFPDSQFFMENSIPDALPFILSHAEIEDNHLQVVYSKKRLEDIVKSRRFASLPPEQRNNLRAMQNELDDSEVLIMILE